MNQRRYQHLMIQHSPKPMKKTSAVRLDDHSKSGTAQLAILIMHNMHNNLQCQLDERYWRHHQLWSFVSEVEFVEFLCTSDLSRDVALLHNTISWSTTCAVIRLFQPQILSQLG